MALKVFRVNKSRARWQAFESSKFTPQSCNSAWTDFLKLDISAACIEKEYLNTTNNLTGETYLTMACNSSRSSSNLNQRWYNQHMRQEMTSRDQGISWSSYWDEPWMPDSRSLSITYHDDIGNPDHFWNDVIRRTTPGAMPNSGNLSYIPHRIPRFNLPMDADFGSQTDQWLI